MRGSQFVFDSIDLLCHRLQKIGLKRGVSYTDSFEWLKNKKATTNPKYNADNCFESALTTALNHKQIKIIQKECPKSSLLLINMIENK